MTHTCAACGKSGSLACQGSIQSPPYLDDIPSSTWYCRSQCQKTDWPAHKQRCKDLQNRKVLHRAAHLIQEAYNLVKAKNYNSLVDVVDYVDSETLLVHLASWSSDVPNSILPRPPVVPGSNSQVDLKAMMLYSCANSVRMMGDSIQFLLRGRVTILIYGLWLIFFRHSIFHHGNASVASQ